MGATELKQTESTRSQATDNHEEEFAKHLFETVREPLLALKGDFRVWLANQAFYTCFQVPAEETLHKRIYDLGNGQWNIPKLKALLEDIIPQNESFDDFEVEHEFQHIGRKIMLLNARRINSGRLILLAIEDVTARRETEKQLRLFAEVAAHDLREPLRMVTSYLALLSRQADRHGEKSEEYIQFAIDGARRMGDLINNLMALSSVGRLRKLAPVDFNLALQNVLTDLKLALLDARARVTKDDLPTVMGDSSEFEQLLQNLLLNAIKYRGKENPKIHISAARTGANWCFKVEDNGMGIAEKDLIRIFNTFERVHLRSEYPGSGLGLSTCRKIVEGHGGRIWVESSLGVGSTFFFTLPTRVTGN